MKMKEEILNFLADRKELLFAEFNLTKLGLFGSFATGDHDDHSDIDLLIEFQPNTPSLHDKKQKLRSIIKDQFKKDVDLCREKYIKPYFKNQILNSVVCV